jgi:hypothetical protein
VSQDLQQLREANEAARLERETMLLRAESAALSAAAFPGMHVDEAQPMREAWGEMVPQTDYPRGDWDRQPSGRLGPTAGLQQPLVVDRGGTDWRPCSRGRAACLRE